MEAQCTTCPNETGLWVHGGVIGSNIRYKGQSSIMIKVSEPPTSDQSQVIGI